MSGFTPFKKHANKFNYLPRYYDPEKEERDRRRAELREVRQNIGQKFLCAVFSIDRGPALHRAVEQRKKRLFDV